jgi:hypothetical protein
MQHTGSFQRITTHLDVRFVGKQLLSFIPCYFTLLQRQPAANSVTSQNIFETCFIQKERKMEKLQHKAATAILCNARQILHAMVRLQCAECAKRHKDGVQVHLPVPLYCYGTRSALRPRTFECSFSPAHSNSAFLIDSYVIARTKTGN